MKKKKLLDEPKDGSTKDRMGYGPSREIKEIIKRSRGG